MNEVLQIGDPILNIPVPELVVVGFNNLIEHTELIKRMVKLCEDHNGMAMASNQIGESIRMFVMMDLDTKEFKAYFNPKIISGSGRHRDTEGCMSFREPVVEYWVRRKMNIDLQYYDIDGTLNIESFKEVYARCIQHEIDHLDGITFDQIGKKVKQ